MINLSKTKKVIIVGGGTAGWFSALEMQRCFGKNVEIQLVESEQIGILGAGEGSVPNLGQALRRYGLDVPQFMEATGSTWKLGVCFEGWRKNPENIETTQQKTTDRYHHLFSVRRGKDSLNDWTENGSYPMASVLVNKRILFESFPDAITPIAANSSQAQVTDFINSGEEPDSCAWHFDAIKLAAYLRDVAVSRGVVHTKALIKSITRDGQGGITSLTTDKAEVLDADFFIDASGFAALLLEKALKVPRIDYSQYLILDSATAFLMPLNSENPPLTTLAKAMKHGWMWVIPTQGRLGCGYVYSSAHAEKADILSELEAHFGEAIQPINQFKFKAGRLSHCWQNNVMAVGLASGFVEPLEATSIAQTLSQLSQFGDLLMSTRGLIPHTLVNHLNRETAAYWDGIVDFLILHYDTARNDTPFWQAVGKAPKTASYLGLKETLKHRTPNQLDFIPWQAQQGIMFGPLSWYAVGVPMGIIQAESTVTELAMLPKEKRDILLKFAGV